MGLQFQLMKAGQLNPTLFRDGSRGQKGSGKPEPGGSCGQSRPTGAR